MSQDIVPLLNKGINRHVYLAEQMLESPLPDIFHMGDMDGRYEDEFMWELYQNPQSRGPFEPVEPGQIHASYGKRWTPVTYALGDMIAEEDWNDDQYAVLTKLLPQKGGALARAHKVLREIVGANFFSVLAFAAAGNNTPTMSDGRPLFDASHPVSLSNSGVLFSNTTSTSVDLSNSSFQVAASNIRQQPAPNNTEIMSNQPRCLVVNPNQNYVAKQVLRGDWQMNSAERNQNWVTEDGIDLIQWAYFRKSGTVGATSSTPYNAWFVLGKDHQLYWKSREDVTVKTDYATNVLAYLFVSYARFVCGALDWRGSFGSGGY